MIRSIRKASAVAGTCYVDASAQLIGDVILGEHASVWIKMGPAWRRFEIASARIPLRFLAA
jgi:hypothetical protein